jgi:hypothetical protein
MSATVARFDHLVRLTDETGIFEHADGTEIRLEHGYCTDDNARLLVVASRERAPSSSVRALARTALRFVASAQGVDGRCRNRMSAAHRWLDHPRLEDCWGRSVWGLGTAAARDPADWIRQDALARYECSATQRSPWVHAMVFAGLGAAEVLAAHPQHQISRDLLRDAAHMVDRVDISDAWRWPESRLQYASAAYAEVMIAAGVLLDRDDLLSRGLDRLGWLLAEESSGDHLSVTPAGGRSSGDVKPAYDQQPIEVAALADACARAAMATGHPQWAKGVSDAVAWFRGENDSHTLMWDPQSGGGFDGLTPTGANTNQGAESTLAFVATMQHADRLVGVS